MKKASHFRAGTIESADNRDNWTRLTRAISMDSAGKHQNPTADGIEHNTEDRKTTQTKS